VDKFLVSMMRFSTAMTLFGLEQVQEAVTSVGSGEDMTAPLERMRQTMDAFSDAVMNHVDEGKRETLDTVTRVSEDTVQRAFSGVGSSIADPREMVKNTADMMKRTSDSVMGWMDRKVDQAAEDVEQASEALGGSQRKTRAKAS
jgi:hypothetical protein